MKKLLSCILCVAVILSVSAAETVAKFASLKAGAKSLGYMVAAHESGGGFCVTGGKSWSITDGVTVVLKYSGLPSTGDQALVTLKRSGNDQGSWIGVVAHQGQLVGYFNNQVWTTQTGTLPASDGMLVVSYRANTGNVGFTVWNAEGTELYRANLLVESGTYTIGERFDFGNVANETCGQDGFVVEAVEILKGVVVQGDVAALLENFAKTSATQAFVSQVGTSASGWFTDWSGEKNGGETKVVGPLGTLVTARKIDGTVKYHPWRDLAAKEKVLLSVYGTTDFMPTPAAGKLAVLWGFGPNDNCNVLTLDEHRHLVFVHGSARLDAGVVPGGYHLFTVVFDKANGCGLYIDDNAGSFDATFKNVPGNGWQIGSIYGGGGSPFVKGDGFVPLNIWASEEAFIPMVDQLALTYPAVTTIAKTFAVDAYGETVYLPSLTVPNGCQLRVLRGTLVVPASVEATLGGLEFGDVNTGNLGFGMVLDGTINIVNDRVFTGNDATQAYNACNEGRGVNFGEWAGQGTITIRGTFNASNTVVEVVHDAAKVTINVDGGTFRAQGLAAKTDNATINLTNNGTLDLGQWPSVRNMAIAKNYASGTVTTTGAEYDTLLVTGDVTLNFANNGQGLRGSLDVAPGATCALRGGGDLLSYNQGEVAIRVKGTLDLGELRQTAFASTKVYLSNGGTLAGDGNTTAGSKVALDLCANDANLTIVKDSAVESRFATITGCIGSHKDENNTNHLAAGEGASEVIVSIPDAAVLSGYYNWQIDEGVNVMFGEQKTIAATRALIVNGNLVVSNGTEIATATTLVMANGGVTLGETAKLTDEDGTELECVSLAVSEDGKSVLAVPGAEVIRVDGFAYASVDVALKHLTVGSSVEISDAEKVTFADGVFTQDGVTYDPLAYNGFKVVVDEETGAMTAALAMAESAVLRFSEIMPKPVDKPVSAQYPATLERMDVNGLESGWVELENTSDKWVNLKDYKFCRANRGKVYTHADYGNFPEVMIPPHGRFTFYTSERYSNSYPEFKDGNTSAFEHGTFDGKPIWYNEMLIWGDKVNPKKFPYVSLVYRPAAAAADQILETVIIPSDTPEGYSIIVGHDEGEDVATQRWLCATPTKNAANSDTTNLTKIGPNVGPAYGAKHSVTEFGPVVPAKMGEPYTVTMNVNPVYTAVGTRKGDVIESVTLVYRRDLNDATIGRTAMRKAGDDEGGDVWTAEIPAEAIPLPGHLLQWKTEIVDAANNHWISPSFMNKDDGYEWFGTITEPGELNSAKLPTWHLFVGEESMSQMDIDADKQTLKNNARVAIYDASTSNYYDYVRIDLRGNTSAHFAKKSHGLRFSKVHPLTMKDVVRGGEVKEIRKSSLIGEPADPSFMRQMVAFWLWDKMGNKVPFDFPVRCNLNGAFYQLAFHSERFTDELIEDVYGFDKFGYGYKNVGTLKSNSGTTAGGIEKKTPDDGNETDITVLQNELRAKITAAGGVTNSKDGSSTAGLDNEALTKFVVEKFDLPAWLNYLASARITQEMDDVWANVSIYYDNAEMKEGARGTGTWMPLGYDFNLTFGQWYYDDVGSGSGLMATNDWFKSHPFYGGNRIRCYKQEGMTTTCNDGNNGFEAVWQSAKFRRLYLRRLRTLMDQELKAPGAAEEDVPFMAKMRELATLMEADAVRDQEKWPHSSSNTGSIDVWRNGVAWPATMKDGIDDIWNNYVVPRQTHLYVTHSVTNTAKTVGYATTLNAGIPEAQSSLEALKEGLTAEAVDGGIVIRNANDEAVDLSGWDVTGPVVMKLPAGTVVDMMMNGKTGEVYVVTDRRAYVATHAAALTDEVIVGNAALGSGTDIGLTAADGTVVLSADVILPPGTYTDVSYDVPVRLAPAGAFTFQGVKFNGGLAMGEGTFTLKNQNGYTNSASVVEASSANIAFTGKGAFELKGEKTSGTLMTVNDLYVSNGVFTVESKATTPETAAVYLYGSFAVEDKGTVNLKLTKNAAQGRGFFLANKNMFCRIGKGGTFNAELNGSGCQAIHGEKGSVDLEIFDGAKVVATGSAANARYFKMAGHIKVFGGAISLKASGSGTELLSSDKNVEVSGGELHLESTDDCVSAAKAINVSGGTIVGKSSANDVLDSNGTIVLLATVEGHEGLDSDPNPPDEKDHAITITGGIVYSLGGVNCDLREPEAGGQTYCVADLEDAAGYVAVSDGTVRHVFVKPAGARTALVSLAGLTGAATTPAALAADARTVVAECYWTETISADTPTWEEAEVTDDTPLAELVPAEQAAILARFEVKPTTLAMWAKAHHAADTLETEIDLEAFALDCATDEVEAKKKAFKVTITFDPVTGKPVVTKAEGVSLNVEPTIKGSVDLINWHDREEDDRFFKAVIRLGE